MSEDVRNIIIYDILEPSIYRLYQMDFDNIRIGVSERNICDSRWDRYLGMTAAMTQVPTATPRLRV